MQLRAGAPEPSANVLRSATALLVVLVIAQKLAAQDSAAPPVSPELEAYRTRWQDPEVQKQISENIDRYRKETVRCQVLGSEGMPVPHVQVEARQETHAFLFGCNAFVLGQLDSSEKNRKYEDAFVHLFNFATVPFYWEGTEPVEGELRYAEGSRDIWRRPPPDRFLSWAKSHGITLKGHPLLWHAYNPSWLPKDAEALKALYQKRFREITARYRDHIRIWDVVNESLVCPPSYALYDSDRSYVGWAFRQVAPLFPEDTVLMINEVTSFNFPPAAGRYEQQIEELLTAGIPVRGIGLQFHYFRRQALDAYLKSPNCDPKKLLAVYERLARFGLPIYITEITIPSAGDGGDALQAEVVRDHYRLWFSAPNMAGITWWNLGDGTAVQGENEAKGGLLDENLDPKPAYRELERLIRSEWTTHIRAKTDGNGWAEFRGFAGKYSVQVVAGKTAAKAVIDVREGQTNGYTITLPERGERCTVADAPR
ncbi:endo-1,4-beta-xylanase [Thermopirellula anaerolimosa]